MTHSGLVVLHDLNGAGDDVIGALHDYPARADLSRANAEFLVPPREVVHLARDSRVDMPWDAELIGVIGTDRGHRIDALIADRIFIEPGDLDCSLISVDDVAITTMVLKERQPIAIGGA